MKRSLILILFLIPVVFSFEYDDDLDYKRYNAAYEYIMNSTELDGFYAEYNVEEPERTFCLSKMIESFAHMFMYHEIEYEFGLNLPENPDYADYPDKERYIAIRDSLIDLYSGPSKVIDYVDLSGINDSEINCRFKVYFSNIDNDKIMVKIPYVWEGYHVHDRRSVNLWSNQGLRFLIYFSPGSDSIRKVFSYSYVK